MTPVVQFQNRSVTGNQAIDEDVVGFADCASVSSGKVVNRVLVAGRRDSCKPRVSIDWQSEPALTRGYTLSPASRLSALNN